MNATSSPLVSNTITVNVVTPSDVVTTFMFGNCSTHVHLLNCKDAIEQWNFSSFEWTEGWSRSSCVSGDLM